MKEIWKPVKGYEGLYEVSNTGRIQSLPKYNKKKPVILHPTTNKRDGRLSVMLSRSPQDHKRVAVHRLVAIAFVDNPNGFHEVNHKDENPQNNNADNLEWCTRKYNMNYGTLPQRLNEKNRKPVIGVDVKTGISKRYGAVRWTEQDGFTSRGIYYSIATGRPHKGYLWRYANDKQ